MIERRIFRQTITLTIKSFLARRKCNVLVTLGSSAHKSTCTILICQVSFLSLWTPVKCHVNEVEKGCWVRLWFRMCICPLAVKSHVLNCVPGVAGVYPVWHDTWDVTYTSLLYLTVHLLHNSRDVTYDVYGSLPLFIWEVNCVPGVAWPTRRYL